MKQLKSLSQEPSTKKTKTKLKARSQRLIYNLVKPPFTFIWFSLSYSLGLKIFLRANLYVNIN